MKEADHTEADHCHHWEPFERAVLETEVLEAVYGGYHPDQEALGTSSSTTTSSSSSFRILLPTRKEMDCFKRIFGLITEDDESISAMTNRSDDDDDREVPKISSLEPLDLQIEIRTHTEPETRKMMTIAATATATAANITDEVGGKGNQSLIGTVLRCLLPQGYPENSPAFVTSIQIQSFPPLNRSSIDCITRALNERAKNLIGTEAIMKLVEEMKELVRSKHQEEQEKEKRNKNRGRNNDTRNPNDSSSAQTSSFGRRWIWVHHITSKDRIKSIRAEAECLNLKGILKHGYPGVVLVEGRSGDFNTFVKWIKGDKSSPLGGGFGRNWGHHVRGEIDFSIDDAEGSETSSATFKPQRSRLIMLEETEDLSDMANYCKDAGLEEEFREFALKHK